MGFERSLGSLEYIQQFKQKYSDLSHRSTDHELQDKLVLCVTIYLWLLAVKMWLVLFCARLSKLCNDITYWNIIWFKIYCSEFILAVFKAQLIHSAPWYVRLTQEKKQDLQCVGHFTRSWQYIFSLKLTELLGEMVIWCYLSSMNFQEIVVICIHNEMYSSCWLPRSPLIQALPAVQRYLTPRSLVSF